MKTRLVLRPGQRGTRQLCQIYGDKLLYVRYRYDMERQLRIKTAEIVIDQAHWSPHPTHAPDDIVYIVTGIREQALQERIRAAGGRWLDDITAWEMSYAQVVELGLIGRIIENDSSE